MLPNRRSLYALLALTVLAVASCSSSNDADANVSETDARHSAELPAGRPDAGYVRGLSPAVPTDAAAPTPDAATVTLYKNPTCECCEQWADHLRANGFTVVVHQATDLNQVKTEAGVPEQLATCHTARAAGYVIEGHVPADVIQQLLRERPSVVGIAVPGMPRGVPGMDGPIKDRYDVIAFERSGATRVYASR